MAIWIELISFHIALVALSATVLLFVAPSPIYAFATAVLVVSTLISYYGKFYSLEKWRYADSGGASIIVFLGHFGTLSNAYLLYSMSKYGAGSGLFLFPGLLWSAIFYGVGIAKCSASLTDNDENAT